MIWADHDEENWATCRIQDEDDLQDEVEGDSADFNEVHPILTLICDILINCLILAFCYISSYPLFVRRAILLWRLLINWCVTLLLLISYEL